MRISDPQDPMYFELAYALALMVYARCCAHSGTHAEYEHFNENDLGIAPDVLARLGVMQGTLPNEWMISARHVFNDGWTPEKPLHLTRHVGEPSIFDLIIAAWLMVDWDRDVVSRFQKLDSPSLDDLPVIDLKNHRRFQSEPQIVFHYLAFQRAANCLVKLGLGEWSDEGHFDLINAFDGSAPIDFGDIYAATRNLIAQRLGGVNMLFPDFGERR